MKILHYLPDIDKSSGGVLSYIQILAKSLDSNVDLHIVTCHTDDEMPVDNCEIHYISVRYFPTLSTKREFLDVLHRVDPDVFHSNSCWIPTSALTAIWAKEAGYKVVYTPHGMLEPWILQRHYWTKKLPALLLYQKRAIRKADMIHATSAGEMNNFLQLNFNHNISVVPNAINVDSIPFKDNWTKSKHLLYLGRIHEKKGIRHIIEAVAEMRVEMKGYVVDIVGDSDIEQKGQKQELIKLARQLKVDDVVVFHDGVYDDNKWNFFLQSDALILPTYSENFGIVVAEALATGLPVVTTMGTPWVELQTSGCGWWINIGTGPLVNALRELIAKTDAELEQMGRNGRQLVERRYGAKTVGKEYIEMYKWVMKSN
ncbi:MAG: glycosyltransferase [Bacteroidales bacterium]|nr:glycosyltransferase [Bacteroidales bacterium]